MSKEDIDYDKEIERLSRKTNVNIKKSEVSFDNQLKKMDKEIDKVMDKCIKDFDENKELASKYHDIEFKNDTINRYREKLKKI
jgi:hypothetical protein